MKARKSLIGLFTATAAFTLRSETTNNVMNYKGYSGRIEYDDDGIFFGQGNFKNMFLHVPNGKKDGVQIIHLSEVAAKDEFLNIKNVTRDDVLAAHRVPPQLIGVIPQNNGGFGDVRTAAEIFFQAEIEPLMSKLAEVNEWAGREIVRFTQYQGGSASAPPA